MDTDKKIMTMMIMITLITKTIIKNNSRRHYRRGVKNKNKKTERRKGDKKAQSVERRNGRKRTKWR